MNYSNTQKDDRKHNQSAAILWDELPLFRSTPSVQSIQSFPRISNSILEEKQSTDYSVEDSTSEPLQAPAASEMTLSPAQAEFPTIETIKNVGLRQRVDAKLLPKKNVESREGKGIKTNGKENVELRDEENGGTRFQKDAVPVVLKKPVRQKKLRSKKQNKKCSQTREVVSVKVFVLPAEKVILENMAKEEKCSVSNFVRLKLALAPNETGRKKHSIRQLLNTDKLATES